MDGLGGGKVGMEPDLIAGLEVGYAGDGEGYSGAGDVDVDVGSAEVKTRLCFTKNGGGEQQRDVQDASDPVTQLRHGPSLDVSKKRAGRGDNATRFSQTIRLIRTESSS